MKHLKFTYVDAVTGISVASEPALNGTKFPAALGLVFVWARESAYPTQVPEFFGTCPADADTQIDGVLGVFEQADWEQMKADEMADRAIVAREAAKAARAINVANIKVTTAVGNTFDGDETSQTRMSRAILVLSTGAAESVPWVLANNIIIQATAAELTEALALAGAEQARLWVLP